MTNNELLAEINLLGETSSIQSVLANTLRAVVELHKPESITTSCPDGKPGCLVLHYSHKQKCSCGFWNYPCPTIQAIERELS